MDNIGIFLDSQPFIALFLVIGLGYAAGNANPATGYAIAYPFGVLGPILCFFLFKTLLKPKIEVPAPSRLVIAEARADERGIAGLTISEVLPRIPKDVGLLMIRRAGSNMLPDPSIKLEPDDILSITGLPDTIGQLKLGNAEEVRSDRRDFDYVLCFVSKPQFVGMTLIDLPTPKDFSARVVQVRRGGVERRIPEQSSSTEISWESSWNRRRATGSGTFLVMPSRRSPSSASFRLASDLCLVVSWASSRFRFRASEASRWESPAARSWSLLCWDISAGLVRSIGTYQWLPTSFCATSASRFSWPASVCHPVHRSWRISAVTASAIFIVGVCVLLTTVLTVLLVGYFVLRMDFDELLGVASGVTGNPAILAYANQSAPTDKVNLGYAIIFPGVGTILKIIAVQVMVALGASGVPPG